MPTTSTVTTTPMPPQRPVRDSPRNGWLLGRAEPCLFWALVAAYLIPVWGFRYFPTQDGPVHLSSSIILKEYGAPGTVYDKFFELRLEPIPNWTAHLVLAGLMFVVPPLVAEKILLSIYLLALAGSLRYFCGSFGARTRPLALVGLLFAYNRCLWLGFYNSDLGLVMCLLTLGYWLRRRAHADLITAAVLSLLLMLTFFTHLLGFLVTGAGLTWLTLTGSVHRWRNIGWLAVVAVPSCVLTLDYFDRTSFVRSGTADELWNQAKLWLQGRQSFDHLVHELTELDGEYFYHHVQGALPMGLVAGVLYVLLTIVPFLAMLKSWTGPRASSSDAGPARWPVAILALGFLAMYVMALQDLGEHGGFIKTRLALLPPLLVLGCFQESALAAVRWAMRALVVLVLAINLVLVMKRVESDNRDLAEYTAGVSAAGTGHTVYVLQDTRRPVRNGKGELANPLLHASQYYCLDTGNVNLDNYQATTNYFPLQFRKRVTRGRGLFLERQRANDVDVVLAWDVPARPASPFQSVFRLGRLEVFAKRPN